MDTKNDDSAGSDSLDKSLQMKCVVDDAGDGILQKAGTTPEPAIPSISSTVGARGSGKKLESDVQTKKFKTEAEVGDGATGGIADSGKIASIGMKEVQKIKEDNGNIFDSKAKVSIARDDFQKHDSKAPPLPGVTTTESDATSSACSSTSSSSTNSSPGKAFETKVKQISKNLKETTLADAAAKLLPDAESSLCKKISLEDTSSSSSSSNSCEFEQRTTDREKEEEDKSATTSSTPATTTSTHSLPAAQALISNSSTSQSLPQPDDTELETSLCSSEANDDEESSLNHRSKKVRFHPDVKENDGGNRVIPKKKKKMKAAAGEAQFPAVRLDFDMDLDEEEDEEEEEFDLAKTIAEAQDYLKLHPLTFARPQEKGGGRLQNGLMEEEDLRTLSESSEEEDVYENSEPENGVERILGKQIKAGKVSSAKAKQ